MLKIRTRHLFSPFSSIGNSQLLELSPVVSEDDELIQAIEQDANYDQWNLESIDTEQLHNFWAGVQQDIANDPEWVHFTSE